MRKIYRKWTDHEGGSLLSSGTTHFLSIDPDTGKMTEISFEKDEVCELATIATTQRLNQDIFKTHKQVCSLAEYKEAQQKAISMITGKKLSRLRSVISAKSKQR